MVKGDIICRRSKIWAEIEERGGKGAPLNPGSSSSSMLKPQQQQQLLRHDWPPVFGKPWYWQRTSGSMDSTRSLAHVILEMREEIKKLEAENRELRGGGGQEDRQEREEGEEPQAEEQVVENPYGNLRRNASAPVLDRQLKGW